MATSAPTPVSVDLTIRRKADSTIKGKFVRPAGKNDQEMDFDGENLLVSFNIVDNAATGLVFPDDPSRAIWVKPVSRKSEPCPSAGSSWSGFRPVAVTNNNMTLQVEDANTTKQLFKFQLNFTNDPSNPTGVLEDWDPIGNNRNGQFAAAGKLIAIAMVTAAGAALAALARIVSVQQAKRR